MFKFYFQYKFYRSCDWEGGSKREINTSSGNKKFIDITLEDFKFINSNAYRLDLPKEYGVSNTFNVTDLVPFAGIADLDDEASADLRTNPLQEEGDDAILPRKGPITRAMARRLQEDWARDAREGPRVLISLRVDFEPMG